MSAKVMLLMLASCAVPAIAAKSAPEFDPAAPPAQNASTFLKAGET